ncbi:hypothetical protein DPMN_007703 [Dreissena polymorpha]|uniref:Uncharacterized protein n=2 Tax=Dreissena polymorpha TaxID=45954 RepID=A0A9D4MXG8_DREPO|nr:hypothetical protein DPMN_007703 [Dreissena polymorpha]
MELPPIAKIELPSLETRRSLEMARSGSSGNGNSLKQPKEEVNIKYMHRPPRIAPNYGNQRRSILPKSKLSRVLLYDNATQEHMLDIKLANIRIEKERISRIIDLNQKSFLSRMMKRHGHMQSLLNSSSAHKRSSQDKEHSAEVTLPSLQNNARPFSFPVNGANQERGTPASASVTAERNASLSDIKLPVLADDKRHVIFKVKDKHGKMEVYHTVDERGVLADIIPSAYTNLTDDPRFKSLHEILVPLTQTGV